MDDDVPSRHAKGASDTPAFTSKCKGTRTDNHASIPPFSFQKTGNEHHGNPAREEEDITGRMKDMKLGGYAKEPAHEAESSVQPATYSSAERDATKMLKSHVPLTAMLSEEESGVATQQSGNEDEGTKAAGEQKPKDINVARYFWSRLDLAYQLYLRKRHDECRRLILDLLPMASIPPACRSQLLQQLAVIEPLEQAMGYLDEVDDICRDMEEIVPGSEQVAQLRNKTANLRRLVRRVDDGKRQTRKSYGEMDA